MKKKLLTLLIFGALSASLIACGKEVQLNDNNVRAAKSIIKTVDAYLEGILMQTQLTKKSKMNITTLMRLTKTTFIFPLTL